MAATRKRKGPKPAPSSAVLVPPIQVIVQMEPTDYEGGRDGGAYGDVLLTGEVNNGGRFAIADKLRELASAIASTTGDPMVSASITILLRRPH